MSSSITIDNLSMQGAGLYVAGNLTVLQNTNLSSFANIYADGTADLGSLNSQVFSNNTLDNVRFGGAGTIQWRGAQIHTIGSNAAVTLFEDNFSIRNSTDNTDALANLSTNAGSFSILSRTFTTSGNFSNTGYIEVNSFAANATFSINGSLQENTGGVLTAGSFDILSDNGTTAVAQWQGASIHTIESTASVSLNGANSSIRNSTNNADALVNLSANAGSFNIYDRDFTTSGNFSNTGYLSVGSYNNIDATFSINGSLQENTGGVITAGGLDVHANATGNTAVLQWQGASIQTIGSNASISLTGDNSFIRNSTDNSDALANLSANAGSFSIGDRTFTTGGNFSNTGHLAANSDFIDTTLSINGSLQENTGGVLTAGSLDVRTFDGTTAVLQWQGASIQTIGSNATVSLTGDNSFIRNSTDNSDALANLSTNAGTFSISHRNFTTSGSFTNDGTLAATNSIFAVSNGGNLTLNSGSNLEIWITTDINSQISVGSVFVDGNAELNGNLYLKDSTFDDLTISASIDASDTFEILSAQSISGNFENILSGERIYLENEIGIANGSFLFTIDGDHILLSDYQAVPEPSTYLLFVIGTLGIALVRRKRNRDRGNSSQEMHV
ncbi:MAG: PEP-CTERM sorting domain-containing protein [Chthoniobacterales bacterium]